MFFSTIPDGQLRLAPGRAWLLALALLVTLVAVRRPTMPPAQAPTLPAATLPALPLAFAPNLNPEEKAAYWVATGPAVAAFSPGEVAFTFGTAEEDSSLRLRFDGAAPAHRLESGQALPAVLNAYPGADPGGWREQIPLYSGLVYRNLYPGIDLAYDGAGGVLKGTYTIAPGADPAAIGWRYEGAAGVRLDPTSGELRLRAAEGWLVERAPVAWQIIDGRQQPVAVAYALAEDGQLSFELGDYDASRPLVIDPALLFGTFLGGSSEDYGHSVQIDPAGNIYVVGSSFSANFLGQNTSAINQRDALVAKLSPQGNTLVFLTFAGGDWFDDGVSVDAAANGTVYVSVDIDYDDPTFPLVNPIDSSYDKYNDGALMKLNSSGQIVMSTYVDMNFSAAYGENHMAVDVDNSLVMAGSIYDPYQGDYDIAVKRLNAAGTSLTLVKRVTTTASTDHATSLAIGPLRNIYLTGQTFGWNSNFPVTAGALQPVCGVKRVEPDGSCGDDAFLMIISSGGSLVYSSYLGGYADDDGRAVAVDPAGNIYVAGTTFSADIETHNALQATCPIDPATDSCWNDTFVMKLSPNGQSLIYSTYLNSTERNSYDFAQALAVDGAGNATIVGFTNGEHFPVAGAWQASLSPGVCLSVYTERLCYDAFVTRLGPTGTLVYSSYLGGTLDEEGNSVALDATGNAYVLGTSQSANFPTTAGSLQPAAPAARNFFLVKVGSTGGSPPPAGPHRVYLPLVIH
jgi:hypothetical protein